MNIEEALKSLKVIKEICEEQADCDVCPFGNLENDCVLHTDYPHEWTIPEKQIIRLLV